MQSEKLFFGKLFLILHPTIRVIALKVGETSLDGGRDWHGRSSVLRHALDEDRRNERGHLVRESVDERGDSEYRRI